VLSASVAASATAESPILWPEEQREFYLDGPGWLLYDQEEARLLTAAGPAERAELITALAADIAGDLEPGALEQAIERRRTLVREELLTLADVRARLLFLHGPPAERLVIDCGLTFEPLEIWTYDRSTMANAKDGRDELVLYQPRPKSSWRLWTPYDGKRALYTSEMEYFLEQWEEYSRAGVIRGTRFDRQACRDSQRVDRATGVDALSIFDPDRPTEAQISAYLEPPADRSGWVRGALAASAPEPLPTLPTGDVTVVWPDRDQQRLVARFEVRIPAEAEIETVENIVRTRAEAAAAAAALAVGQPTDEPADDTGDGDGVDDDPSPTSPPRKEIRLSVEGLVEQEGEIFDDLRVRYVIPAPDAPTPLALVFGETFRPGEEFLLRLRITDEIGGAVAYRSLGFRVPEAPDPSVAPLTEGLSGNEGEELVFALGDSLGRQQIPGADSLILIPPVEEVVLELWRAEALVSGERIEKVVFSVDGVAQMTDGRRPFSAEVRLADYPVQQVIRAEGLDAAGNLIAADEVTVNQPRGAFEVRITDPPRGASVSGEIQAVAEVTVPLDQSVEEVTFEVDGTVVATLTEPPWTAPVTVGTTDELSYLSVKARLDDGTTVEDVRFLNAPDYVEELDVDLVEIYAAVLDRSGRPVLGLGKEEFSVRLDGAPVEIERFDEVRNLPLTVGIALDTSGSMESSLAIAQQAAQDFLAEVVTPRDRAFAVGFSDRATLLMAPTEDVRAVSDALGRLRARGWTAFYDAVITSLYYFRSFPGQRALVVLTDGEDTRSRYAYREVLEYARRSGVSIYTIGLEVGALDRGVRQQVRELAEETGGQSFFIRDAAELAGVYEQIEQELRSRYFLGVTPPGTHPDETEDRYRRIEVDVAGRGRTVRTAQGAYQ
jgi:VWFA-related protein